MADDEIENLTHGWMRKLDAKFDRMADDIGDMKLRLAGLEQKVAYIAVDIARIDSRIDGVSARLTRIEKRLELVEA